MRDSTVASNKADSMKRSLEPERHYRLWIGQTGGWQPRCWRDVPPRFLALEPADGRAYSARHALAFLEGFNSQMLAGGDDRWAVAVALEVLDGELLAPRRLLSGRQLRRDGPLRDMRGRNGPAPTTSVASASAPTLSQPTLSQPTVRFVHAFKMTR